MSSEVHRRILITGGAGFIGYHLARRLSDNLGNKVVLVDNFVRGQKDNELVNLIAKPNVEIISADLTQPETYTRLGCHYDEIYHLAAIIGVRNVLERPHEVVRVNALSTLFLLDWFVKGGGERLLYSSTSETYAWTQLFYPLPIPTPEDVPLSLTDLDNPRSSYAGSKIFGELALAQFGHIHNKSYTIVRYHNVYGPRMGNAHVIPELHTRALSGQDPLVVYSANYRRAFCYVSDAITATILAMRKPKAYQKTINIGNDQEDVKIGDLAKRILKISGIDVSISHQKAEHDPVIHRCPDISLARKLLGYEPSVKLDDGLKRTLAWYEARQEGNGDSNDN